jgi:myosin heavy subunit
LQEEEEGEEIQAQVLHYYDNKPTVDELMAKPDGLFHLLDEASKTNQSSDFILGELRENNSSHIF